MPITKITKPIPFDEILEIVRDGKVAISAKHRNKIPKELRQIAFFVAHIEKATQAQGVLESLQKAIKEGQSFRTWKETATIESLDISDFRKETIYRTNLQTVYGNAIYEKALDSKDSTPYLMYDAINDSRVRESHAKLDGIIKPVDSDFWKTHMVPNGYNCRCSVIRLTETQADRRGGVTKNIPTGAGPDKGFEKYSIQPLKNLERIASKKAEDLPRSLKQKFRNSLSDIKKKTDIWWEKNKAAFEDT